jgi:hypothetical protein
MGCSATKVKRNVWEIVKKDDGSFDMFHKGNWLHSFIPNRSLEAQLGRYGFCGQEDKDIRRQLDQCGKAEIVLHPKPLTYPEFGAIGGVLDSRHKRNEVVKRLLRGGRPAEQTKPPRNFRPCHPVDTGFGLAQTG